MAELTVTLTDKEVNLIDNALSERASDLLNKISSIQETLYLTDTNLSYKEKILKGYQKQLEDIEDLQLKLSFQGGNIKNK